MPILYNTGDWFSLRPGKTYRKYELYNMEWPPNTEIDNMLVSAAYYGGPMAIVRNPKLVVKNISGSNKPIIKIFTASGNIISSFTWNSGTLMTLGWSDAEELLCVQDDGLVVIYDIFGKYQHKFSMGPEAKDTKIIDAKIFPSSAGTGVCVMTTNFRIILINNIKDQKIRQLPEMPKSVWEPTCWETITEDRNTHCLVAREKELFKLRQGDSVCSLLKVSFENSFKSIVAISVSYNHKYLALYTNNGILWLGSADLKTKYCEFNTGRAENVKQMEWILDAETCTHSDAIIITYPSLLIVVSVEGDSSSYSYDLDPSIFLIPEMDGVRIITNSYHEMIQEVPKCVSNIFAINSQEPGSWLFEAHKKFCDESHQSDEYLCLIKNNLPSAVSECIEAAGHEFDTETQKSLIRTAYFGKSFIPSHNPDDYIKMCRVLRVLNAIRHPKIGIPLTLNQFNHLKPNVILDRLVFRKHYGLSIHIAKHLKLPESRILEHWAFHKVINDTNDEDVAKKISEKFRNPALQGISFCNIAKKAQEIGRKKLAIMLLELEPKSSLQVPLLLKLGENKKALFSATQSGDTDLVYSVLMQLKETTQLAEFLMIIREFSMAQNLYKKYCQLYSKTSLQDIYMQEDDFLAQAEYSLKEGIETSNLSAVLTIAANAYKNISNKSKEVESDLCNETKKLLDQQQVLSKKHTHVTFVGITLHDTIHQLLLLGDLKLAEKMKNDYKVSDRRYWWLRISVLAEKFQWEELEKFSKSKKSPIGFEPFVEICLKHNNKVEAKKYLAKCKDEKKIKWFIRAGMIEEAATAAFEQRDLQSLYTIHMHATKTKNTAVLGEVENFIGILSNKK